MSSVPSKLQHFPVAFFSVIMGLAGFTMALEYGVRAWGIPAWFEPLALWVTAAAFALIALLYLAKWLRFRAEVAKELLHPVKLSFFPTFSISLILLAVAFLEASPAASRWLLAAGAAAHLLLTLLVLSIWIGQRAFEIQHINPAWFIPAVGNILVPIAGTAHFPAEVSWFFFSVGLVFWLVLLTIIFYRVIFHHPLPERLVPTLFILIAPPAAGFIAYVKLAGGLDAFARILYYTALFMTLLLATQARLFFRITFYLSWWAYSFPLAAITLATALMYELTGAAFFHGLAVGLFALLTAIIVLLAVLTVRAAARDEICVPD